MEAKNKRSVNAYWVLNQARVRLGTLHVRDYVMATVPETEIAIAVGRHRRGDWGLIDIETCQTNECACCGNSPNGILSKHETICGTELYIYTDSAGTWTEVFLDTDGFPEGWEEKIPPRGRPHIDQLRLPLER